MYYYYPYVPNVNQYQSNPYVYHPYVNFDRSYPSSPYYMQRQQTVQGQALWTEGGPTTVCGIPWSHNDYMTAAVGAETPYQCGQKLKVRNVALPDREIEVTIVDRVPGYPMNRVTLHKNAFEELGADLEAGIINVEFMPSNDIEDDVDNDIENEEWANYVKEIIQTAYPGYNVTDINRVEKTEVSPTQVRERYEFQLQSPEETIKVRGRIIYHPETNRVKSFDLEEVENNNNNR
ncbi:DUF3889 domain-containing protein [Bacillus shivajii]|uniref:DUF3889 domain-containing protein n=1 Tax=Bacillus shivajii TaxID=1983719 RepID=UPI001CF98344|nr:DUF3889 domain-containing protein [Bacillus shivajii]UCZ53950.1 DUF3889 domain-containing protein [Bacillus shivajii]